MAEQHLSSNERDFNSKVQQLRDIAARFERARHHCFNTRVQRFRNIAVRLEDWTKERVRLYSIRRRRTAWIERFTESQRRKRECINCAEIAEWCSEESGVVPNEVAREAAYRKFLVDLLEGDFEENGHSQMYLLHPYTAKTRMTRECLTHLLEVYDETTINLQYLAYCWMRRERFDRFLAKHRMQPRPERFEPKCPAPPTRTPQSLSQARKAVMQPVIAEGVGHSASDAVPKRRFGPEPGTLRRYDDADRKLFPELERIMAEKQKSLSAAAFDLAEADQIDGTGTPQSRAKRLAALYKRDRGG
jgi:hypothetical protein